MSIQEGNLRRVGDSLVIGCTNAGCVWSATLGSGAAGPWNRSAVVTEAEEKLRAHLQAEHPPPARFPLLEDMGLATSLLTDTELAALDLSGKLANVLSDVVARGPTAGQDTAELHHHLHAIQRYIGSQAAARAYPDRFRLLGEAGAWNDRAARLPEPPANPFEGDREQARAMGFCPECGDDSHGHTYAVNCWWMRRWQQKDATW